MTTPNPNNSFQLLQNVVTVAPIVLFSVDREGIFTLSEGRGLEKLGLKPGAVVGMSVYDVYKDYPEVQNCIRRALAGEDVDSSVEVEGRIFECWYSPLKENGQIAGVRGVATDITDVLQVERALEESRKKYNDLLEERLRQTDERYRVLSELAPVGIMVFSIEGTLTYANEAALKHLDLERSDVGHASFERAFQMATRPNGKPLAKDDYPIRNILQTGNPVHGQQVSIELKNGERSVFSISSAPLFDKDGNIEGVIATGVDTTQQHQVFEELQDAHRFVDSIVENIPAMIFVKDAKELRFVRFNRAGENMLGYSRVDMIGKNDFDFFPEKEARFFTSKDREVLRSGQLVDIPEEPIQTRHTGERLLHTVKVPIQGQDGTPKYLLGISEDVTERKYAEEALKESEERFRQLAENVNDAFWILTTDLSAVIYVSRAFEDIWGRRCDDVYQTPSLFFDAIHPADRGEVEKKIPKRRNKTFTLEYRVRRPDDEIRWIRTRGFPIRNEDGEVYRVAAISEDITAAKHMEHELRLLATITETSVDAISAGDMSGKFTFWNQAAERIFGFRKDEILGKDIRETLIPPEHLPEVEDILKRRKQSDSFVLRMRTERLHKNGRKIPVMTTSFPLLDESGKPYSIVGIHQDLTEIVAMEEKLMAKSRMAAIGEMAAGVAHEIRNPLFGISTVAQILARQPNMDAETQELATSMLAEIDRLNKLLQDLLLYARPRKVKRQSVVPKTICEEFQELHSSLLKEKDLQINASFEPPSREVNVDPDQIRQVLLNLCINAIEASAEGGTIEIKSNVDDSHVWKFQIHNGGEAIRQDHLFQVYDPFFSSKQNGSGLGLSVCKKIVEEHGGMIHCVSTPTKGTTFTISIPPPTSLTQGPKPVEGNPR